jgi:hypothetical protein
MTQLVVMARPPAAVRRAKLDNVTLVPASLLPYKEVWQTIANDLPDGTILICIPTTNQSQRLILERVVSNLQHRGHRVATVPTARFA